MLEVRAHIEMKGKILKGNLRQSFHFRNYFHFFLFRTIIVEP